MIFTARRYAIAVYAVALCLPVCLSVRSSVRHKPVLYKMAQRRITKIMPYDSSGILIFWCQRSR